MLKDRVPLTGKRLRYGAYYKRVRNGNCNANSLRRPSFSEYVSLQQGDILVPRRVHPVTQLIIREPFLRHRTEQGLQIQEKRRDFLIETAIAPTEARPTNEKRPSNTMIRKRHDKWLRFFELQALVLSKTIARLGVLSVILAQPCSSEKLYSLKGEIHRRP